MTDSISWWGFLITAIILLAFAGIVMWKLLWDPDALKGLLAEGPDNAKASLSRLQFLVFTFVIAGLFLLLSIETGGFVEIPNGVLALMGISGGTYLASKAVSNAQHRKR